MSTHATISAGGSAGAVLTIDLAAIAANYQILRERLPTATASAVVKADAYGLGAMKVAPALYAAGCRHFFVAHLEEALTLRPLLPTDAELFVLHGPLPGTEAEFVAEGVIPVLNSLAQVQGWGALAAARGRMLPAFLQVDTGMARLGLAADELAVLAAAPERLAGIELRYVMSHLACAEVQDHPANAAQLDRFNQARALLPPAPASLANSSGIFLGPAYHFDLVRPGAALYGVAPVAGVANPMRPVIRLQGRVIQLRGVAPGTPVGYGATWRADGSPRRIATVAVGYADGFLRSLGNRGTAYVDEWALPVVGMVSMDTITLDASAVPAERLTPGSLVDLIGPANPVDMLAGEAQTIGYEILTNLGHRYARHYIGG